MQLSAEETLFCKPANYTRVAAAAAGSKVVCVQMALIALVHACVSVCEVFIDMVCVCLSGTVLHMVSECVCLDKHTVMCMSTCLRVRPSSSVC